MGKFFNFDNPVLAWMGRVGDAIFLSAFWVLCSLPIFTIGASSTALYYSFQKVIKNNRGYVWKEFYQAFKANFKQSTIIWLTVLGIYAVSIVDIFFARQLFDVFEFSQVLHMLFGVVIILVTMWMIYLFPYIARFENTTKATMKNCAIIAIANFPRTLLLTVVFVISVIAFTFVPFAMLFVPALNVLIANRVLEPVFRKYMSEEDIKAEEERNSEYIRDTFGEEETEEDTEDKKEIEQKEGNNL